MQSQNIFSPSPSPVIAPILFQTHLPSTANKPELSKRPNQLTDTGKISPSRLSLLTTISNSTSPLPSPSLHPYHEDICHIIKSEVSDNKSVQCLENIKREINYKQQSQYVNFYQYFNLLFGPMNSFSEILKRCTHLTDISEEEMNKDVQFIKKLLEEDGSDEWQIDSQPQANSQSNLSPSSNVQAVAKNAEQSEKSKQHSRQISQGQSESSVNQPSDSCGYSFRSCSYNQNSQKQNIIRPASRHQPTQIKSSYHRNGFAERMDNSYSDEGNEEQDEQSQPYENQPFSAYQSQTPSYLKNQGSKDKFEYQIAPIQEDDEDDLHVIEFSSSQFRQSQKENHMPPKSIDENKVDHRDEAQQSSQNADTSNILASSKNISRSGDPLSQYFRFMNLKQEEDEDEESESESESESQSDGQQSSKLKGKQKYESSSSSQIQRSNESSLEQSISMSSSEISQLDKIEDFSDSLSDQIKFNEQSEFVSQEDQSDRQKKSNSESQSSNNSKNNRMYYDQISDKKKKKIEKRFSKSNKVENDDEKEARRLLGTQLQRNIEKAFIGLIKTVGESLGF